MQKSKKCKKFPKMQNKNTFKMHFLIQYKKNKLYK